MIDIAHVKKEYDGYQAVDDLSMTMREGEVFGLLGTNGAGKTTLLRMMAGVLKADSGEITIDGLPVYDNPKAKELFFFIPDEVYFFPLGRAQDMAAHYAGIYPDFSMETFSMLMERFGLDAKRRISGFSKGMKKQLAVILGLSSQTKYLLCDETFDGLDPVMRQATKSLMAQAMEDRGLTTILTSHNLRELEDICDHVGLLHKGGVLLSKDIADLKIGVQKVQVVYVDEPDSAGVEERMTVLAHKTQGRLHVYTVRQTPEELSMLFADVDTAFYEILPLTLEEIFISETEVAGYDISKIIFG